MENRDSLSKRIEQGISKARSADCIQNLFSSITSLTLVGTPFASLINSFIPSRRMLRLEEFVKEIAKSLEDVEDRIDSEYLNTDEFAYLFEHCIKSAADNYQEEKLNVYKAILVNSLLPTDNTQADKEFYLNLTNQLTTIHLIVLLFCSDTFQYLEEQGIPPQKVTGNLETSLISIFKEFEFGTIRMAINDLSRSGLINLDIGSLRTMTSNQGMNLIGDNRLTESGKRYVDFISI